MNFVIIGGDAAGMSAASRAKRNQPDMNVIVLEKTEDVSYSACGMPYNIADPDRKIEDLVVRRAEVFREKQGINLLTDHCVEKIDRNARTVTGTNSAGESFTFSYDKLLIATGGSPVKPEIPGVDLPGVMPLKILDEGRKIKAFMARNPVKKVVIIGMGYIGLEMCEALRSRNIGVDMVKPRIGLLPWMAPELAAVVREEIALNKVGIFDGHTVDRIEQTADGLKVVCGDIPLKGEMVLLGIGVSPNSELAAAAGLEIGTGGAIAVDRQLRTSDPDIFAAGDCADAFHVVTGQKTWIPLALRANRAGWAVADNVCGGSIELPGVAGTAVFKVFDLQVARTGLTMAEAKKAGFDPAETVIKSFSRAHVYPGGMPLWVHMLGDRKSGRLLGVQMVGKESAAHRINAPAVALHAGMTVVDFCQCDLGYAPPFGPTWDPLLTAANQLLKKM